MCLSGSFSILNIGRMLLSGSDEAVGIDSGDNPDAGAEVMVASLAQLIIDRWIRNSAFPLSGMRGGCHL